MHYTRAADVPPAKDFLPPGLTLTAGRPRTAKVLDSVIARAVSYGSGVKAYMNITGVVVGVCGPIGIGDEVSQAVSAVDPGRRWAVGGIEIHEECVLWGFSCLVLADGRMQNVWLVNITMLSAERWCV